MGGYDPDLDNLQAFCSLLEGTNHALEAAVPGLRERETALARLEPDLREECASVTADADAFESEAAIEQQKAGDALAALAATAHALLDARLPALESDVVAVRDRSDQTTSVRCEALQADFGDLDTAGFRHGEEGLGSEEEAFERWSDLAGTALGSLADGAAAVQDQLSSEGEQAATAVSDAIKRATDLQASLEEWLDASAEDLAEDTAHAMEQRAGEVTSALVNSLTDQATALQAEADAAHAMVESSCLEPIRSMDDAKDQAQAAAETAAAAVGASENEFSQTLADAEATRPEVSQVASLRPSVVAADAEMSEILAVLEALHQP